MEIHPDSVNLLAGEILERAVKDYRYAFAYKRKHGKEPREQHLNTTSLKAFFRSKWFNTLCDYDGEKVIQEIEKQVIQEELEKQQQEFEEACK